MEKKPVVNEDETVEKLQLKWSSESQELLRSLSIRGG